MISHSLSDTSNDIVNYEVDLRNTTVENEANEGNRYLGAIYPIKVNNTLMKCFIPIERKSNIVPDVQPGIDMIAKLDKIISNSFNSKCTRTRDSWWFFEFCWAKHLAQYHFSDENPGIKEAEFFHFQASDSTTEPTFYGRKNKYDVPYLSYQYGNGSWCKDMGKNRTTEVRVYCSQIGSSRFPNLHFSIERMNSCSALLSVYVDDLCAAEQLQPVQSSLNIRCVQIGSEFKESDQKF